MEMNFREWKMFINHGVIMLPTLKMKLKDFNKIALSMNMKESSN